MEPKTDTYRRKGLERKKFFRKKRKIEHQGPLNYLIHSIWVGALVNVDLVLDKIFDMR